MTKKEKDIMKRYVNTRWDTYLEDTSEYGANSDYAIKYRSVLDMLWNEFFPNEDPRGMDNEDEHDNKGNY